MALRRGRDSGNDPNALSGVGDRVTVETTKRPLQYQRLCTRVDLMTTDCYRCNPADLSRVSRGSNRYDSGYGRKMICSPADQACSPEIKTEDVMVPDKRHEVPFFPNFH